MSDLRNDGLCPSPECPSCRVLVEELEAVRKGQEFHARAEQGWADAVHRARAAEAALGEAQHALSEIAVEIVLADDLTEAGQLATWRSVTRHHSMLARDALAALVVGLDEREKTNTGDEQSSSSGDAA